MSIHQKPQRPEPPPEAVGTHQNEQDIGRRTFLKMGVAGTAALATKGYTVRKVRGATVIKANLKFLDPMAYPEFQQAHLQQVERWNQMHPDAPVSIDLGNWADAVVKTAKAYAAGDPYDIIDTAGDENMWAMQQKGLFQPINDVINELGGKDYFVEQYLANAEYQGDYWGVPARQTTLVYYYRKDWLEELGLSWPKNWDELLTMFKAATRDLDKDGKTDVWGALVPLGKSAFVSTWAFVQVLLNGGHIFDREGKVVFDSPQVHEALEFIKEWYQYSPPGSADYGASQMRQCFNTARCMINWYSTFLMFSDLEKYNPDLIDKVDIAHMVPKETGGEIISRNTMHYFTLSSKTKYPDEAKAFLKYLASPENLIEWQYSLPESQAYTVKAALKSPKLLENPRIQKYGKQFWNYQKWAAEYGRPMTEEHKGIKNPKTAQVLGDLVWLKCLQDILVNNADIQSTTKKYARLIEKDYMRKKG